MCNSFILYNSPKCFSIIITLTLNELSKSPTTNIATSDVVGVLKMRPSVFWDRNKHKRNGEFTEWLIIEAAILYCLTNGLSPSNCVLNNSTIEGSISLFCLCLLQWKKIEATHTYYILVNLKLHITEKVIQLPHNRNSICHLIFCVIYVLLRIHRALPSRLGHKI